MRPLKVAFLLPAYMGSNHSMFLGVAYLSSAIKKQGHLSIILDEDAIRWIYAKEDEHSSLKKAEMRVIAEIEKYSPDVLCISINTTNLKNGIRMLSYVRHSFPEVYMIVGGPHISVCSEQFRIWHRDLFDAAIVGEGEDAINDLLQNLAKGKNNIPIPGIIYSSDNLSVIPRNIVDINNIEFPDREAFFIIYNKEERIIAEENYTRVFYSHLPGFENSYARIVASRGCYNNCTFCSPGVYWKNPLTGNPCRRIRSAKNIVDEIESLIRKGVKSIYFDDPTFPIKSDKLFFNELEKEILDRKIVFKWGAPICSSEVDIKILDRLQKIGFTYTYFGLENYKEENLKDLKKMQDVQRCLELIKECKARGIHCDASYQIGLPNETVDDIKKSIDWIFKNKIEKNTFFSITAIWPGTILAKDYGVLSEFYEPSYDKKIIEKEKNLFYYEQGNPIIEQFYSNCSGTYHFIPIDVAIEMKYYAFDSGLVNRFKK